MNDINFTCPKCRKTVMIGEKCSGLRINCPYCSQPIVVPSILANVVPQIAPKLGVNPPVPNSDSFKLDAFKPAGIVMAAILCGIWAMIHCVFAIHTILAAASGHGNWDAGEMKEIFSLVWNMILAGTYILFVVRILFRDTNLGYFYGASGFVGGFFMRKACVAV
jgi:DNA-directed RNA polymerase subunit RPC12/RpoP